MKLEVSGNINEYYVQTLCMLFFPGSKFSKAEKNDAETPYANVCVDSTDTCATATVSYTHLDVYKRQPFTSLCTS